MADEPNPTLARRELAVALKRTREQRERTPEDLASFLQVSLPQVSRLESGARGYQPNDVRKLASWYDLRASESGRLLELAAEARKRAWWQKYELPDGYRTLIGLERAARTISEYTASVIPGLLQTAAYARVQVTSWNSDFSTEFVDQAVEVRLRRQEVLSRVPAPKLQVVIDEVGLARAPRDPQIRRDQFEHLLTLAERPGITVQVIGLEAGMHPGVSKQLILLEMDGRVPDVVYTETIAEPLIIEQDEAARPYRRLWDELRAVALDSAASRDRIAEYIPRVP